MIYFVTSSVPPSAGAWAGHPACCSMPSLKPWATFGCDHIFRDAFRFQRVLKRGGERPT
jgi:hypothetical protein